MTNIFSRTVITALVIVATVGGVSGQSLKERAKRIKESADYLYGEGSGATLDAADKHALEALISQITVSVKSTGDYVVRETEAGVKEDFSISMQTYSVATLPNVEQYILDEKPEFRVLRAMSKADVAAIFETRRSKILNYIDFGRKKEADMQIGDAMRYYNWGLILLHSYPYPDRLNVEDNGQSVDAKLWLDSKINEILKNLKVSVVHVEETGDPLNRYQVSMDVLYKDAMVANLDYSYHNNMRYVGPSTVKDGRAVADFEALPSKEIRFRCETLFTNQAKNLDPELYLVMQMLAPTTPATAVLSVPLDKRLKQGKDPKEPSLVQAQVSTIEKNEVAFTPVESTPDYTGIMAAIEKAIRTKKYETVSGLFTDEGYKMFNELVHNGNASIIQTPQYRFVDCGDMVLCRSIPMQFRFSGNRGFVEDVTFRFNADKKIESLAFTLTKRAEEDILTINKKWSLEERMTIVNFLEDYQTAYALKRIDYLESIFSDDALIITGTVITRTKTTDTGLQNYTDEEVRYNKMPKEQFIEKLRASFASKEYINLRFDENQVVKATGDFDGLYAIQIKQDYYSNNYGDTGFLTLAVDLRHEQPLIKVRVWQRDKNPDFTAFSFLNQTIKSE
ncbi:MAG: hypothetical protein LBR06_05415 [Bacteroidales bacterium]|jgi:hypothetical protein|nr:hypothetical protein [Bacteroidales bacterium]